MTEPNATPAKREKLPLDWAEDEGFHLTPSVQPSTDPRAPANPPLIIPEELTPPPISAP